MCTSEILQLQGFGFEKMAPNLDKECFCEAFVIDYAMFPAVGPPTTEHIVPRFDVNCILWLRLGEFGSQNLVPNALFELGITFEFGNALLR